DAEVAEAMNRLFVSIKVDREERPDLDQIYQTAHQIFARRGGGWPLTMFLTPDQVPFYAGTYFPKHARHNLPGFVQLMQQVERAYRERRQDIEAQNQELLSVLARYEPGPAAAVKFDAGPLEAARAELGQAFDRQWGGFSKAPKFPRPAELEFLLRRHSDEEARSMALLTLERMLRGGLIDQLGGGFYRYSVDERWAIPHFEKMLYDNGPLLGLMADAWALTGDTIFSEAAERTVAWLAREMTAPAGAFYSAQDADSEHVEGKFYVWTPNEVRALLSAEQWEVAALAWSLDQPANFEAEHWHLQQPRTLAALAEQLNLSQTEAETRLDLARRALFAAREKRVHPGRDDKILTSWNALMITGLAHAGRVMGREEWIRRAQAAADLLRARVWVDGRLYANLTAAGPRLTGYLDDYAFMLEALLELLHAEFRADDLTWAREIADALLEHFEDAEAGGFFFTAHDHEALIHRSKPGHDNATPSGNAVAAWALNRLGLLLDEPRYTGAAERTLALFWPAVQEMPMGFTRMLALLEELLSSPALVVVRGPLSDLGTWRRALSRIPGVIGLTLPNGLGALPDTLNKPEGQEARAWICQGQRCLAPIASPLELTQSLQTLG
ncbi:MAG TPA: thioredoxin domain-containing protein, partial [Thiobacillaceae bacterium]|nr:thioredoxin domain-containing protein [Thiobacillaceae bacterium]